MKVDVSNAYDGFSIYCPALIPCRQDRCGHAVWQAYRHTAYLISLILIIGTTKQI